MSSLEQGPVLFWDSDSVPTETWEHMVSHLAFVIVIGILVFVSHNPVCAIGLFVTLFFSVLYHMALSLPHKNDEQYQKRKAFYVNLFSVFDYVGIISGSTLALVWNKNILVMPSAWTWATLGTMIFFFVFMTIKFQDNRVMHSIWHFVAVTPLLVYALVDLKSTADYHGPQVVNASIFFFALAIFLTFVCTWVVHRWGHTHSKTSKQSSFSLIF